MARAASMGHMGQQAYRLVQLSEGYMLAGCIEDASDLAARAFELSRLHKERGTEAWTLRLLGDIAMHRDPQEAKQAENGYQQALALAEELGMRPLQAHCHRALGALYSRMGRVEQTHTALSAAIQLYRTMEMTFWLPQVEAALARVEAR